MRGALSCDKEPEAVERIIPAYAGSTPNLSLLACRVRDHPRVCGEHLEGSIVTLTA